MFLQREAMIARYIHSSRVCLSVRLSARPSVRHILYQVVLDILGIVSKRLNIGSSKQRHTIDREPSFLLPKITAKFQCDHPNGGAK